MAIFLHYQAVITLQIEIGYSTKLGKHNTSTKKVFFPLVITNSIFSNDHKMSMGLPVPFVNKKSHIFPIFTQICIYTKCSQILEISAISVTPQLDLTHRAWKKDFFFIPFVLKVKFMWKVKPCFFNYNLSLKGLLCYLCRQLAVKNKLSSWHFIA